MIHILKITIIQLTHKRYFYIYLYIPSTQYLSTNQFYHYSYAHPLSDEDITSQNTKQNYPPPYPSFEHV